jgi:ATP phosphoribosyltransferase regulatory subunit
MRPLPQRLCYSGSAFRHVQPQLAQYREFHQLGVELLGVQGPLADAEVIHIADQLLVSLGLEDCKISLNHIGIFNGLLQSSGLRPEEKERIKALIAAKDMVGLRQLLQQLPITQALRETLLKLPVLHGGIDVFRQLPYLSSQEETRTAVEELRQLYSALRQIYGSGDRLVIDMGVLRGFDYYTGMIFEGYSPRLGYGLLGGGRYDRLMEQFGVAAPATGFAVGVERLDLVLVSGQAEQEEVIFVAGLDLFAVSRRAEALRADHPIVVAGLRALSRDEAERCIADFPHMTLDYI